MVGSAIRGYSVAVIKWKMFSVFGYLRFFLALVQAQDAGGEDGGNLVVALVVGHLVGFYQGPPPLLVMDGP